MRNNLIDKNNESLETNLFTQYGTNGIEGLLVCI